jgi:hypothetical protein
MRSFKRGLTGIAAIVVFAVLAALVPGASAANRAAPRVGAAVRQGVTQASSQGHLTSSIRGTFGRNGVVTGTFHPDRFMVDNGVVYGVGTLHATLTRGDGTVVGSENRSVSLPVHSASYPPGGESKAVCDILDLVLGPLHLNLLGLHVDLKKVVLHITAVPGSGQLLGNLLCAIAHLLDGTHLSTLLKLANVLNRILTILGA